jgi:hypothetical protein
MADYLAYSHRQVQKMMPMADWSALSADQHESLAAFRVRFSEYQEHLGKTMRAIAIEEEAVTEPFGAVLALMEKLGVLDSVEHWKLIRDLRSVYRRAAPDARTGPGACGFDEPGVRARPGWPDFHAPGDFGGGQREQAGRHQRSHLLPGVGERREGPVGQRFAGNHMANHVGFGAHRCRAFP